MARPALVVATFMWAGKRRQAVATDVTASGAFFGSDVFPPLGTILSLAIDAGEAAPLVMRATVTRVVDRTVHYSVLQGIGVRWLDASGCGDALVPALRRLLRAGVDVTELADGRVAWAAGVEADDDDATGGAPDLALVPVDRRRVERHVTSAHVRFFIHRETRSGTVRDVSLRGLYVDCPGSVLAVGDLVTFQYPLSPPHGFARLVGRVVRTGEDGFAVEVIRIDNRQSPGAFEAHVLSLGGGAPPVPRAAPGNLTAA